MKEIEALFSEKHVTGGQYVAGDRRFAVTCRPSQRRPKNRLDF